MKIIYKELNTYIIMSKNIKIKVKEKSEFSKKDMLGFTRLVLNFSGKDINYIIINSLRRIILSDIPIYAYNNFNIIKNTSVFNNNYIKSHVKNIPVWGIENKIDDIEKTVEFELKKQKDNQEEVFDNEKGIIQDDVELEVSTNTDYSSLNKLTMYVEKENKTDDILSVTTDDCSFYYKENSIKSPYYNPVQIVKLQPNQEIKLSVQANLGTTDENSIFSACSTCHFIENDEDDYDFILESRGQISEVRIIKIGINLILKRLRKFYNNLPKNKGMEGLLKVENEDHLLGNLLTYQMQNNPSVKFCGYSTPHPLNNEIVIEYKLINGNLNSIFKDIISYYEKVFKDIEAKIS